MPSFSFIIWIVGMCFLISSWFESGFCSFSIGIFLILISILVSLSENN